MLNRWLVARPQSQLDPRSPAEEGVASKTPPPARTALCALALVALTACSGRLDQREASSAAVKGASLFEGEFSQRAPTLTASELQTKIEARLEKLPERSTEPRLVRDYFSPDKPVFVSVEGPSEQLKAITALCEGVKHQDISTRGYPCDNLKGHLDEIEAEIVALGEVRREANLDEAHIEALQAHLMTLESERIRDEEGLVRDETLVAIMFGAEGYRTPLPHIEAALLDLGSRQKILADKLARVEIAAHEILMRYAWDLRASHGEEHWRRFESQRTWLDELADTEVKRTGQAQDQLRVEVPEGWPRSGAAAQSQALQKIMAQVGQRPAADIIAAIVPPGDQYNRLIKALARYRGLSGQGGFTRVAKPRNLRPGKPSEVVQTLRKRLVQEGFEAGTGDPKDPEVFDGALEKALEDFQRAHQLNPNGKLDKDTLAALNVPVERKIAMIKLALRKWREAVPMDHDHVYINIPDFHGELWTQGKRQHRFRVVVGDKARKWQKGKGKDYVNATPETLAFIDRVVYNPFWNVPKRIFKKEILRGKGEEMEDEERHDLLKKKGFQVMGEGTDYEWIRQPPGPGNALGQVKIIFPNPHEIYMHDTQSKNLFSRPVRAFSHGCVRVHEPLTLARKILEHDGQYDGPRIKQALQKFDNEKIFLKEKLPVYINYITVRVGEDGTAHFLNDIYQRDAERLASIEGG